MSNTSIKLKETTASFMRLIQRSPDCGRGWRTVSVALHKLAEQQIAAAPEMFEQELTETGGLRVRLSIKGQIIGEYL